MALSRGSRWFLIALAVVVALAGGVLWYVNDQLSGEPGEGQPVEITVPEGATAADIGGRLAEEGVVKNALAFRLVARSEQLDSNLRAGTFRLRTGMSVDEAIDVLQQGPAEPDVVRFTVPEGLAVPPTLQTLADQTPHAVADYRAVLDQRLRGPGGDRLPLPGWLPEVSEMGDQARHPFEGTLFPETYQVERDAGPQVILQTMIDQLVEEMAALTGTPAAATPGPTPTPTPTATEGQDPDRYRAMIVASLIERESRVDGERPRVAGVIYNRLDADMPLQIDATVLYALGQHQARVLTEDTEVDSPYNTYQVQGLPPTPIAGFGTASLRAALNPADTDARYYVLSPACDGSHVFAETLEQHNQNVAEFEEAGSCRGTGRPTPAGS